MTRTHHPLVHIDATLQFDGAVWKIVDLRVERRTSTPPKAPPRPSTDWEDRLAVLRRGFGLKSNAQVILALRLLMRDHDPAIRLQAALLVLSIGLPLVGASDGAARS
jgi:hypothetical protein